MLTRIAILLFALSFLSGCMISAEPTHVSASIYPKQKVKEHDGTVEVTWVFDSGYKCPPYKYNPNVQVVIELQNKNSEHVQSTTSNCNHRASINMQRGTYLVRVTAQKDKNKWSSLWKQVDVTPNERIKVGVQLESCD